MTKTIYLDYNSPNDRPMCDLARRAFPAYSGRKYEVRITDAPINCASSWSGGSRDYFAFVNLDTGQASPTLPQQSAFDARVEGIERVMLPAGFACVEHSIFMGKDHGLTLIVRPENAAAMLPAPVELPEDQQIVLYYTASRKSSYNGKDRYAMMVEDRSYSWRKADALRIPTRAEWDAATAELITAGYLTRAKAITPKGRNAAPARLAGAA